MKLRLPWQKMEQAMPAAQADAATPAACPHARVEVEMHGTAIKRRWCAACGEELPVPDRH